MVIDQIFAENVTYLEELLFDTQPSRPLHMLLASPGGDGETAIRIVRSIQARCSELTVIVPDLAKSAATLICLGADRILMGPAGDLGPVDTQFVMDGRRLVSAKEVIAAVERAEERVQAVPHTAPLYASLLENVDMLLVEQSHNAHDRDAALVAEALGCVASRRPKTIENLTEVLKAPLIDDPKSHSAVISPQSARKLGLPVVFADPKSAQWQLIWVLWTRYFTMGCFPRGFTSAYEGNRASHIMRPPEPHP